MVRREQNSYDRNSMLQFFETDIHLTMTGIVQRRLVEPVSGERCLTLISHK